MKPLKIVGILLVASGVLCLGIAAWISDGSESKAPLLVAASGVFDILLGAGFFMIGRVRGRPSA